MTKNIKVYFLAHKFHLTQHIGVLEAVRGSHRCTFEKNVAAADLMLVESSHLTDSRLLKLLEEYPEKPMIIINKADTARLSPTARTALSYPNVKFVYSGAVFKDKSLYNSPLPVQKGYEDHTCPLDRACDYHHFPTGYYNIILNETFKEFVEEDISKIWEDVSLELLDKIKCGPHTWMINPDPAHRFELYNKLHWDRMYDLKDEQRSVVINYIAQSWRGVPLIGTHRRSCIEEVQRILRSHYLEGAVNHYHATTEEGMKVTYQEPDGTILRGIDGTLTPVAEYQQLMEKSRIVVSPWGGGEWCQRDAEAMYAGAVLIKPLTDHIDIQPSIFQEGKTYVPCKVDFSDLEEKVLHILHNWSSYKPMRLEALKTIKTAWDLDKRINLLHNDLDIIFGGE